MTEVVSYPGVYVAEDTSPSISVSQSATAVPVFIGEVYKTDGSQFKEFECVRVSSWLDFCSIAKVDAHVLVTITSFPNTDNGTYTYASSSTISMPKVSIGIKHYFENGGGACYICPYYDISQGSKLPTAIKNFPEITLLVPLCETRGGFLDATYVDLNELLGSGSNYFLIADSSDGSKVPSTTAEFTAVYYPALIRDTRACIPGDADIPVVGYIDEKGSIVNTMADLKSIQPSLYQALTEGQAPFLPTEYPLTPAAAMAGIYCSVDRTRGCWKAPANVPIHGVLALEVTVTNAQQGKMNSMGINVIRDLPGRGITPWGARTLANSDADTSWRFVPVRRLFNSAEADIRESMRTMMFEPNVAPTWEKMRSAIDSYLFSLWRSGALAGTAPEEAYFVQIGKGVTMSDTDIAAGKMIVKVGMAAAARLNSSSCSSRRTWVEHAAFAVAGCTFVAEKIPRTEVASCRGACVAVDSSSSISTNHSATAVPDVRNRRIGLERPASVVAGSTFLKEKIPMTEVSYPGVYVAEDSSPSISVNHSATAVPVFIGEVLKNDGNKFTEFECLRVSSWLDFCSIATVNATASVAVTPTLDKTAGTYSYTAEYDCYMPIFSLGIKHYFENGGGACYIYAQYPVDDATEPSEDTPTVDDKILGAIKNCPEITLLVPLDDKYADRSTTCTKLNDLLIAGSNYFLIADSDDGTKVPSTEAAFTAVYYPSLIKDVSGMRPGDASIPVTGYVDTEAHEVKTMADLKSCNTTLYDTVTEELAATYFPPVSLTPAPAMAGIYCSVDRARGCWKAPANVPMYGVLALGATVTNDQQGTMNSKGINVIRDLPGRGITPWGARTLAGADSNADTSWRYVPVRRLFNSAEADIRKSMRAMMFEPNVAPTWEKVRSAIDSYLFSLWRSGALAGTAPEEAYFVQIGKGVTMSDTDIAAGKMIVKVGMAAARPAEFIILQFTQDMPA
ncbi:phage tail sheath subtilisin-like domain-containing protein [Caballeronia sp. LZ065]|uniref:phage tail sheath family protein n=1 Tax=Caballeronia sp. LZ065 TaxID=3038571 RepID=UPI0028631135|nr:phage tail sheath C-terminal domain-containing protein [Caballeronia sp. LZ065]MDR5782019.1 phage tail sheath subtilisin-like domain-containing protein [Caballeronia sp. LZ065]